MSGGRQGNNGAGSEYEDPPDLTDSMTSIAKCSSTLELHTPQDGFSAIPFLLRSLRVYTRLSSEGPAGVVRTETDTDTDLDVPRQGGNSIKDFIFADIPVSCDECERGWDELSAFVHGGDATRGVCWRPTPLVKLDAWRRVMEGAVLQEINLEKQFPLDDLWTALLDEDTEHSAPFPRGLFDAVLRRVSENDEQSAATGRKCEYSNLQKMK